MSTAAPVLGSDGDSHAGPARSCQRRAVDSAPPERLSQAPRASRHLRAVRARRRPRRAARGALARTWRGIECFDEDRRAMDQNL